MFSDLWSNFISDSDFPSIIKTQNQSFNKPALAVDGRKRYEKFEGIHVKRSIFLH